MHAQWRLAFSLDEHHIYWQLKDTGAGLLLALCLHAHSDIFNLILRLAAYTSFIPSCATAVRHNACLQHVIIDVMLISNGYNTVPVFILFQIHYCV